MVNRLADSTSPYLLQHADNPVHWQEWGPEAFEEAKRRDVPVLLSVGYSACHWCHVMAHESFEDPATASEMNAGFVNVKVDREERPDVDAIYMEAVQTMTGQGGWPMTVFLTPEGRPFYAGTYFPNVDRPGLPSFRRLLAAMTDAWRNRRDDVVKQGEAVAEGISRTLVPSRLLPGEAALVSAYHVLVDTFDEVHGGFGGAPKFPQQPVLEFLLRIHREDWAPQAGRMLTKTLHAMADGGIYDQLGGGFARYSVDRQWLVPHFEKMLYDNAQLAHLYLWAWKEFEEPRFREVAEETLDYLIRDLGHPDGAFYSAEDADSEGEEGRFYVWDHREFREVVGVEPASAAAGYFGVTEGGNFEGSNILTRNGSRSAEGVEAAARRLFEHRNHRVRPGLDDKIVTSWNGLALRALADAGAVLDGGYLDRARSCARFVVTRLRNGEGRLLRSFARGRGGTLGFLEDYAGLALGLLHLYQATGEVEWFTEADRLVGEMVELFGDPAGGFFTTGHDADPLIKRPKDLFDNPLPSGNSMAAEILLLLSLYTGRGELRTKAEDAIRSAGVLLEQYPTAVGYLVAVLASNAQGFRELAVVGPQPEAFLEVANSRYRPGLVVAVDRSGGDGGLVPLLAGRTAGDGAVAYLCEGFVCRAPTNDPRQLAVQIG